MATQSAPQPERDMEGALVWPVHRAMRRDLLNAWTTTRKADPRFEVEGWGIDNPDIRDDLIAYRAELRRGPIPDHLSIHHLSPVKPIEPTSYFDDPDPTDFANLPPLAARRMAESQQKRSEVLGHIASGRTLKEALEATGVRQATYTSWRQRFPDFTSKIDRIRAGLPEADTDLDTFVGRRRHFFGYESYAHHLKIVEAIETAPAGGITMVLLPPEGGKTTLIQDYISDSIARDPNVRFLYVTETAEGQARKVLSAVKDRMTDPDLTDPDTNYPPHIPDYIARYGPFRDDVLDKDKPWNQDYIKVHRSSGRRDYTFQCAGWKSKIYGARCDKLILDDVQSDSSIKVSPQMLRTLRKTFFSRPGKKGAIIVIGTRVGEGDVYQVMIEEGIVDRLVMIPALDEHGNSYCPEMWPVEELERKRRVVGEEAWWCAYMQQPQLAEDATFTDEMIEENKRGDLVVGKKQEGSEWRVVAGLDPALGGGTAIFVAAYSSTAFQILDCQVRYGLARNEDIFELVKLMARYRFGDLIVEKNALQRGIARDDRLRKLALQFGFQIREHETGRNKWDFDFGVGAMAGSFIRKEVLIPDADEFSQTRLAPLLGELRAWRPGLDPRLQKTDQVMAMWFAWLWWQKMVDGMVTEGEVWKARGTPWKPGDTSNRWGAGKKRVTRGRVLSRL